jgi:hypothetical protein
MTFNINDIRANLEFGGARPTHFQVIITNPFAPAADIKVPFMVKASSIPSYTMGKIEIPYFGRKSPIPGDRVWEDWTVTVMNDEDFIVRDALERWSNAMNAFRRNVAQNGASPNNYKSTAIITQYGKAGNELRVYQINGIFPTTIAPIELNWETTDQIEEFQVTWAFDDCEVVGGVTGDAGGA